MLARRRSGRRPFATWRRWLFAALTTLAVGMAAVLVVVILAVRLLTTLTDLEVMVVSSGSMKPAFSLNELIIVSPTSATAPEITAPEIEVGDIVVARVNDLLRAHRVVAITDGPADGGAGRMFWTRGDANAASDFEPIEPEMLVGEVTLSIPGLGWILAGAQSSVWRPVLFGVPLALLLLCYFAPARPTARPAEESDSDDGPAPGQARGEDEPHTLRRVALVLLLILGFAHVSPRMASAAFRDQTAPDASQLAADVLDPPSALDAAEVDLVTITLTWAASADPYLAGYVIERSTDPAGPFATVATVDPDELTYSENPVLGAYYYRVLAYYEGWTSAPSNQVSCLAVLAAFICD